MIEPSLTLISHHLCPYVQRAAIVLTEKGIVFDRRNIDLSAKPDWFRAISPLGKVPLLRIVDERGDHVLFESAAICEYLEETQPGPKLHSTDALARARHRGWMEFGSSILSDLWVFETTRDKDVLEAKRLALSSKFATIEAELKNGPFFAGENISLVDAVFAPIFRYFDVFDVLFAHGIFDGLRKVPAWRQTLAARPSVRSAVGDDYPQRLMEFLRRHDSILLRQEERIA